MTTPATQAILPVTIPRELFDFLMGRGEIDGTNFGDLHEGLPGRFWWRALLRTAEVSQAHSLPADVGRLVAAANGVLAAMDAYNAENGTFLGGPAFFELGRSIAALTPSALSGDAGEGEEGAHALLIELHGYIQMADKSGCDDLIEDIYAKKFDKRLAAYIAALPSHKGADE